MEYIIGIVVVLIVAGGLVYKYKPNWIDIVVSKFK